MYRLMKQPLLLKRQPSETPSLSERFWWQYAPKRTTQQCLVDSGLGWRGGAEVSWRNIRKIRFAVLPYLFHCAAPGRVLGPQILAPEGGRLSTSKKEWYYRILLYISAPTLPRLENIGGHLLPLGVITPRTMIWAVVLCADAAIDIFYWLSKIFVNLHIDKFNRLCVFLHRRKFSHLQNTSWFGNNLFVFFQSFLLQNHSKQVL